jgi:hypothetical protein
MNPKQPALGLDPRVAVDFLKSNAGTAEISRRPYSFAPAQSWVRVRKIVKNLLVLLPIV